MAWHFVVLTKEHLCAFRLTEGGGSPPLTTEEESFSEKILELLRKLLDSVLAQNQEMTFEFAQKTVELAKTRADLELLLPLASILQASKVALLGSEAPADERLVQAVADIKKGVLEVKSRLSKEPPAENKSGLASDRRWTASLQYSCWTWAILHFESAISHAYKGVILQLELSQPPKSRLKLQPPNSVEMFHWMQGLQAIDNGQQAGLSSL